MYFVILIRIKKPIYIYKHENVHQEKGVVCLIHNFLAKKERESMY